MLALIISVLIQWGVLQTESDWHNLTPEEQKAYEIIITEETPN